MNVDIQINLSMSQRLVMTPMLQQAIKLLQMSRLELVDLVKQEMLENPVLDEIEEGTDPRLDQQDENASEADPSHLDHDFQDNQNAFDEDSGNTEDQNRQQDFSVNWEEYFTDNPTSLGYHGEYESDEENSTYENLLRQPQSLSEYLTWQLQMSRISERNMKVGNFLIGQIDENGYIHCEDPVSIPGVNIHATHLDATQVNEYRASVINVLCQKINAEFEREYLIKVVNIPGIHGILANILIQEYYEEFKNGNYQQLLTKLQRFTLADLEIVVKIIGEISSQEIETLTGVSNPEITRGIEAIKRLCRSLRHIIEHHINVLLRESYEAKLEKIEISPEELYFLEYLLLKLSAEEIAYVASKEHSANAGKREKEIQAFLEKLRQSYAHIESLKSHKYFLIQLYHVGVALIIEKFHTHGLIRFRKQVLKLSNITVDDITTVAQKLSSLIAKFYKKEPRIACKEVEHVLHHIQTFAPSGVGARDLKECLTIQARNLGITNTVVEPIIINYLYELEHKQYKKIVEKLESSLEEVELAQNIISNMSPKPGTDFTNDRPEYIVPDISVYKVDDEYEVVLNEDDLPNLRINPTYKKIIIGNHRDVPNSTKQYVDQKLRSAMWFIRSVEQRKRTIYKVGKSIVKFQREFLEYGVSHLKPLVLRDVADDISMHESTVSRVTTNKYIHTPQGVFELKYFFHSGLESSSGDDVSSIAIKEQIKQMIENEDCKHPLSDKTIEEKLNDAGIAIARRTIAKYREELNIPSSIQRKLNKRVMDDE